MICVCSIDWFVKIAVAAALLPIGLDAVPASLFIAITVYSYWFKFLSPLSLIRQCISTCHIQIVSYLFTDILLANVFFCYVLFSCWVDTCCLGQQVIDLATQYCIVFIWLYLLVWKICFIFIYLFYFYILILKIKTGLENKIKNYFCFLNYIYFFNFIFYFVYVVLCFYWCVALLNVWLICSKPNGYDAFVVMRVEMKSTQRFFYVGGGVIRDKIFLFSEIGLCWYKKSPKVFLISDLGESPKVFSNLKDEQISYPNYELRIQITRIFPHLN